MRFMFLVQGEGRGHMTQAMVLADLLGKAGHEVCAVFIGKSERRSVPDYFSRHFRCPVLPLVSPNFVLDRDNKSLRLFATLMHNTRRTGVYRKSLSLLDRTVRELKPDALINFYDFLGGVYALLYRPRLRHICIGHQYLAGHPAFPFAPGRPVEKWLFQINNAITSFRAWKKVALSFRPYAPLRVGRTAVSPPLLRPDVRDLETRNEGFILGYMVNDGYGDDIIAWHREHPEHRVHCFWDRKGVPDPYQPHENLSFHQIDNRKFLDYMARCSGYVTTAGFESICEAMYLGKPILMIPVDSQYEQACNALDATATGAGIAHPRFDIQQLIGYLPRHRDAGESFRAWEARAQEILLKELTGSE
jgi:uncharacterized protein (TIGR00661 family)